MTTQDFDFYGLSARVTSESTDLIDEVRRDFSYFATEATDPVDLQIDIALDAPPYDALPAVTASFLTPRNVVYKGGNTSYIDYFGQGLAVLDRRAGRCAVSSPEPGMAREIVYLFLLSTVGQHLDGRGLHRIHALGVERGGRGTLLLLPSGGGKSTMAMRLMCEPGFSLVSEDTPVIDRQGRIHPFPMCLGVRLGSDPGVPAEYLRTVDRMEFDPKMLIDLDYFGDRVSPLGTTVEPGLILVGERNLGDVSEITPLSTPQAFKALTKYMVVGLGVYQGLEFLLERGTSELAGKGRLVASRLYNAGQLLRKAPAYRFTLGRDRGRNVETLLSFLDQAVGAPA